ncbi:MAG: ABC transporter permease [Gemmatimonadaceae bacterium]
MLSELVARVRSLWSGARSGARLQAEMDDEFAHHIYLRARDLERTGLAPHEALRQARVEFGNPERFKDEGRAARGLVPVDRVFVSWLDFKLGFRMLARYPGLTLIGGFAMAFAIWVGAGTFEIGMQLVRPRLPLVEGERVVGILLWDAQRSRAEPHLLHDFARWRESVKSVEDLGAFRTIPRNLIVQGTVGEPVPVAEISASAFRVARIPAMLGRGLVDRDEQPGAPAVAVIGHELWTRRFGADSGVVGRTVRLGAEPVTIVGVMPPAFKFPVAHGFWTPLRLNALEHRPRQGPELRVFGRLAAGASMADARAELETMGRRTAAEHEETHEHLRPQVLPYAQSVIDTRGIVRIAALLWNVPILLLLVLVCANVALLMFARAATREAEIVVRTALGASRSRIVTQLFAEALVLGGVAAAVGLLAASAGIRWALSVAQAAANDGRPLAFWFHAGLSPLTVFYALVLTVLGAVIAGVMPALKVTRGLGARLKSLGAGGGGLRFGGVWTAVIVAQIAVTVALPVATWAVRRDVLAIESIDLGFPEREYLTLRLEMDRETPEGKAADTSRAAFLARYRQAYQELERRLASDPAVIGVTSAQRLPRMYHPHRLVDVDEGGAAPLHPDYPAYRVSDALVGPGFFHALQTPILVGRDFTPAEHEAGRGPVAVEEGQPVPPDARGGPVIVNESFVKRVLGGRNPIGRRIRYRTMEEWDARGLGNPNVPWFEIVGVVHDLGTVAQASSDGDPKVAAIYHPVPAGGVYPAHVALHVRGEPSAFIPKLRAYTAAVDPTFRVYEPKRLTEISDTELYFLSFWFRLLVVFTGIALVLSLAGIYSVMSFTVARRTREIGIRIALGASPRRLALAIFRRPLAQVLLGVFTGAALLGALLAGAEGRLLSIKAVAVLVAYSLVMLAICLLACIVPTRRALRVQPTEALRYE